MSNSIFSGVPTATLQTWLTDSQNALHQLALGKQVVRVATSDGKSVAFTAGDVDKLKQHIRALQAAISIASGQSSGQPYSVAVWTR
jgi:hypothetical protein